MPDPTEERRIHLERLDHLDRLDRLHRRDRSGHPDRPDRLYRLDVLYRPDRSTRPASPNRLLIVEDDLLLAATLAMALSDRGLAVETVAGPSAASLLETVRQLAPVLVLLDLVLGPPLGSGLELIAPVISAGGRVIVMSAVADRMRLAACVEAGAIATVSKAAGFGDLVDAVRRAVAGEDLLTEEQRQVLLAELRVHRQADRAPAAAFAALSRREQAVLALMVAGQSAGAIAVSNYVSLATVRTQIRSILAKLHVRSQLAAVAMARQAGWSPQ